MFGYINCLLKKKTLKMFGQTTWSTKKPIGYRGVHHILIKLFKSYYTWLIDLLI